MKPKPIRLFSRVAMLLMMTLTTQTAWAWSGSGTSADPYKIANANDLIQLATDVNNGTDYSGKYFKQTAPITLTGDWTPIGTSSKPFKGKYDGDGYIISGLTVSGSYQHAGLFGFTKGTSNSNVCSLKNIVVTDCNIDVSDADKSYAGGIAGYASDDVQINNCRVSGTIKAKTNAGGIVGELWTTPNGHIAQMMKCFTDVTVAATYKGKLFGRGSTSGGYDKSVFNSKISYYHADDSGVTAFGEGDDVEYSVPLYAISVPSGMTVATTNATLTFNDTPYFATETAITLSVDDAEQSITAFTATGAASSEVAANKKSATITLGSSDVTVSATLMALTGTSDGVAWSMSDSDSDGTYDRLTLSGSGTLSTSPWATDFAASITRVDISSTSINISGNPFSTLGSSAVIVVPSPAYGVSYASAAFAGKLRVALGNYLFLATNEGGTAAYKIATADDLHNLAYAINNGSEGIANGKTFRQTGNITIFTSGFMPIGNAPKYFSGNYDGGGYTISGLRLYNLTNVMTYGLFGYVKNGLVENVRLESPSVNVSDVYNSYYYGALIGIADGTNGASTTIRNCVVISPDIDATQDAHGLIIGKQIDCTLKNLYVCHGREYYNGNPIKVIGEGSSGTNVGRAYRVILGSGISSVSPAINPAATDLDNGFVYDDYLYYRNGVELTLASNLGEAPEGYAVKYTASDGTISGSTLTVGSATAVVSAAIRSDGQSHSISYMDEKGDDATHDAIALDGTETTLSAGWYFVGKDINYTDKITLTGDVNIILADGKTMTTSSDSYGIDGYSNGYGMTIYGQALGTGTLNATGTGTNGIGIYTDGTVTINGGTLNATGTGTVGIRSVDGVTINRGTVTTTGIMADGDVTINGGKVTATDDPGISSNSGNVTLSWRNAADRITASSYFVYGNVTIADGKAFTDEDGNIYTGTLSSDEKSKLAGKTLTPACIISLPEGITATGVLAQNGTTAYAKAGDAITLAVASGYLLNGNITYTPDGGSATAATEDNGTYSFTMPAGNVTVNANIIKIISYIDADGKLQTISNYKKFPAEYNSQQNRRELTTTTLNAGEWYVVDNNITLADVEDVLTVSGSGAANIILCDGKKLEYENWDSGYISGNLNIYGQSEGTGTFNYDNTNGAGQYAYQLIHGDLTIYGGQVTIAGADGAKENNKTQCAIDGNVTIYRGSLYAKGGDDQAGFNGADAISGNVSFHGGSLMAIGGDKGSGDYNDGWGIYGNVTLDWSSASDSFYANRYGHGMTIADGKAFADEDGNIYTGTLSSDEKSKLNGKTLTPACIITLPEGLTATGVLEQNGTTAYAKAGDAITLAVAFGYQLNSDITVTPTADVTDLGNGTYSFTMPAANVTVTATLTKLPVPELTVTDVTATTAVASWTACDGVTSYTLQLASDEQFTTGGSTTNLSEDFKDFTANNSSDISGHLNDYTATEGWTGSKVYCNSEMARIGASSGLGWIMTPALDASGTLTVVWSAYRYGTSDKNTILLGVSENGTDFEEETVTIGDEMTKYTNTFTVSGPTVYVRWMASGSSKARFFLDDISIKIVGSSDGSLIGEYTVNDGTSYTFTGLSPYTTYYARVKGRSDWSDVKEFTTATNIELADNANNTSVIEESHGLYANVTLSGRTLWMDGDWNTIVLPFDLTIAGSILDDADVRALDNSSLTNGTLTLNFTPATGEGAVTEIKAGTPYLIKWDKPANYVAYDGTNATTCYDIVNPVFSGVTIDATTRNKTCDLGGNTSITFCGTYSPVTWNTETKSILFLGTENKLYYPEAGAHVNACRAYFQLDGLTAGEVATARMNFDEQGTQTTGIIGHTDITDNTDKADAAWYTIDGVRLSTKPTAKGLYVHGNKKVVIKH